MYLWAGVLIRISGGLLRKRIMFGNLEGTVRRGRGGKEKEWTDYIRSDGIGGIRKRRHWRQRCGVRYVTKIGWRFMAAWKKEEIYEARHCQEKREATRLGSCYRTRKRRAYEATPIGLVDEPKESYTSARWTEIYVAPSYVDSSRGFYYIPSERAAYGGGGSCAGRRSPFVIFSLFSKPRAGLATTVVGSFSGWPQIR